MKPDYLKAKAMANETLTKYVDRSPISILESIDGVRVMSFQEMSDITNVQRDRLIGMFGNGDIDAITTVYVCGKKLRYAVAYDKTKPQDEKDFALARELGHIILEHDGSKPEEVRNEEAICFAHHLLNERI